MKKKRKKKTAAALAPHTSLGSAPDALKKGNTSAASFAVRLFGLEFKDFDNFQIKTFEMEVTKNTIIKWETVIYDHHMFIHIPTNLAPVGSKESFISLLEIAEEELSCEQVICCIENNGKERSTSIRTFMYMGFQPIPPGSPLLPTSSQNSGQFMFLGYEL